MRGSTGCAASATGCRRRSATSLPPSGRRWRRDATAAAPSLSRAMRCATSDSWAAARRQCRGLRRPASPPRPRRSSSSPATARPGRRTSRTPTTPTLSAPWSREETKTATASSRSPRFRGGERPIGTARTIPCHPARRRSGRRGPCRARRAGSLARGAGGRAARPGGSRRGRRPPPRGGRSGCAPCRGGAHPACGAAGAHRAVRRAPG